MFTTASTIIMLNLALVTALGFLAMGRSLREKQRHIDYLQHTIETVYRKIQATLDEDEDATPHTSNTRSTS